MTESNCAPLRPALSWINSPRSAKVKFAEDKKKGPLGTVQLSRFKIPKTVRMDISLRADYPQRRLFMIAKNLLRTGAFDRYAASNSTLHASVTRVDASRISSETRFP